jgi:hypothetical protein
MRKSFMLALVCAAAPALVPVAGCGWGEQNDADDGSAAEARKDEPSATLPVPPAAPPPGGGGGAAGPANATGELPPSPFGTASGTPAAPEGPTATGTPAATVTYTHSWMHCLPESGEIDIMPPTATASDGAPVLWAPTAIETTTRASYSVSGWQWTANDSSGWIPFRDKDFPVLRSAVEGATAAFADLGVTCSRDTADRCGPDLTASKTLTLAHGAFLLPPGTYAVYNLLWHSEAVGLVEDSWGIDMADQSSTTCVVP